MAESCWTEFGTYFDWIQDNHSARTLRFNHFYRPGDAPFHGSLSGEDED